MPPKKKPVPTPADPLAPEPVRLDSTTVLDESRVTLFTIDETEYTVPRRPRPNLALRFMWESKTVGEDEAGMNLLIALVGDEGFQALMNYEPLTTEEFEKIMAIATELAMGALESTGKD